MKIKLLTILIMLYAFIQAPAQNATSPSAFEKIIFEVENAYHNGMLNYDAYENKLDFHTKRILQLANANKEKLNEIENVKNWSGIDVINKQEQQIANEKLLLNWAIYSYLTDTTWYKQNNGTYTAQYPMQYAKADPFGKENWENTMVTTLLDTTKQTGNCFSLAALYYIFSQRLQTDAYLCTAPQHIFIQHLGADGNYYNIELGSHSFPGAGTIKAYTYTTHQAVENGIAMRRLNEQEAIALCFVQMAKGYENKLRMENVELKNNDFILSCANRALQYDSLCLNALLLKAQVLEQMAVENNEAKKTTQVLLGSTEKKLNELGYQNMPHQMQSTLLAANQGTTPLSLGRGVGGEGFLSYYTTSQNKFPEINSKAVKQLNLSAKENQIDPVSFALSIDPLAEKYSDLSPYSFCANNPIVFIDPDGKELKTFYSKDGNTIFVHSTAADRLYAYNRSTYTWFVLGENGQWERMKKGDTAFKREMQNLAQRKSDNVEWNGSNESRKELQDLQTSINHNNLTGQLADAEPAYYEAYFQAEIQVGNGKGTYNTRDKFGVETGREYEASELTKVGINETNPGGGDGIDEVEMSFGYGTLTMKADGTAEVKLGNTFDVGKHLGMKEGVLGAGAEVGIVIDFGQMIDDAQSTVSHVGGANCSDEREHPDPKNDPACSKTPAVDPGPR